MARHLAIIAAFTWATVFSAKATDLLTNPGFELDVANSNRMVIGWQTFGPNAYSESSAAQAHAGNSYLKVYQSFSGQINETGVYQDYIAGPGAVYAADGWAFTASSDVIAGNDAAWLEISFRDAAANILELYRSALITTNVVAKGFFQKNTWVDLAVTNQYDVNGSHIVGTANRLVAPSGTSFVRYQVVFQGDSQYSGGSVYFDDLNLSQISGSPYGNMNIVWSDEFNGTAINHKIWTYDTGNSGWGNNELEYYTARTNNAYEAGGYLHIAAQREGYNGANYTSARLKSEGLFSWQCGRFEWRAQLPAGVGMWPALWLLGTNIETIGWPGCGEIDVVENNGSNPGFVQGSLHSGSDETAIYNFPGNDSTTNFHIYTLDWNTNALLFYVDGHLYQSQTNWSGSVSNYPFPFNQPFFIIMNVAVGGNYVNNPTTNAINSGFAFPNEMLVDYVRIYQPTDPLRLAVQTTNSGLVLSWPSNIVCHLQQQTNRMVAGLGTNWQSLPSGTNHIQISPMAGSAYFRLSTP